MSLTKKLATAALAMIALLTAAAAPASAVAPASAKSASAQCVFWVLSDDGRFCFPEANGAAIHVEHVYEVCALINTTYAWQPNPGEANQTRYQRGIDPCDSFRDVPGNTTVVAYWN